VAQTTKRIRLARLAEALRAELQRRHRRGDWTTRDLAARACYSQPHLSHLISGKRAMSIEAADAIAAAAGIRFEDLLLVEDNEQPRTRAGAVVSIDTTPRSTPRVVTPRPHVATAAELDLPPAA
jgi:transcriptional regulator with XRE-family HTH domain